MTCSRLDSFRRAAHTRRGGGKRAGARPDGGVAPEGRSLDIGISGLAPGRHLDFIDDWMRFDLIEAPWLVRAIIEPPALPRGFEKLPKILFNNLHMLGRLPAWGVLRVSARDAGGATFAVDLRNRQIIDTAKGFHDSGCYEPEVSLVLDALLAGQSVFCDIGANFGYYALRAAMNPAFSGDVHAFEISPRTFQDLGRFVAGADLASRVVGHNVGLSDITGQRPFWEDQHSGRSKVLRSIRSRPRPVSRLDDFDIPPPDVMKIDVEGHEAAVLAGAGETIAKSSPAIVFEHWHGGPEDLQPFELLEPQGYRFFVPQVRGGRVAMHEFMAHERPTLEKRLNILAVTSRHFGAVAHLVGG